MQIACELHIIAKHQLMLTYLELLLPAVQQARIANAVPNDHVSGSGLVYRCSGRQTKLAFENAALFKTKAKRDQCLSSQASADSA